MNGKQRLSWLVTHLSVAVMLSPLGYVLSVGPFVWLFHRGYLSQAAYVKLSLIYQPISVLRDKSEWVKAALDWYISCFE